ncbi:hypothetical protein MMC16_000181 [Acarospora aff. strigata]|nr:hypothetical protein [Acarospora aff. strigata]
MDFAPYQDTAPEADRPLSPPPPTSPRSRSPQAGRSPPPDRLDTSALPHPNQYGNDRRGISDSDYNAGRIEEGRMNINLFETSLPIRLDYEAMLAYLLLPPAGSVFLLVVEHRSDYVRFHAWQSSMLFTAIFVLHLLLSWSSVLSWLLFVVDLCLIVFLTMRAYRDAITLDRFEVPFIGPLASSFVDSE